jgi:hypothetical protein
MGGRKIQLVRWMKVGMGGCMGGLMDTCTEVAIIDDGWSDKKKNCTHTLNNKSEVHYIFSATVVRSEV